MAKRKPTRVREIRLARKLSQSELAQRAGLVIQTLSKIETGETKSVSLSARRALAPILGVSEHDLLQPPGSPIPPLPGEFTPEAELTLTILREIRDLQHETNDLLRQLLDIARQQQQPATPPESDQPPDSQDGA